MTTFAEQIAAALDTTSPEEAADRVHQVVSRELVQLDPSVKPRATGYFNHSYVPDLVLEWRDGTQQGERPVYLRHSLRSSRAAGDFETLARVDKTALFMSLSAEEPEEEVGLARAAVTKSADARALVTTVPAVDELAKPVEDSDPVLNVVKASVVRSGKGFIQESDVEKFILPRDRRAGEADFEAFNEAVRNSFSEEAAYRINRVSTIVEQALADQPDLQALSSAGELTEPELRSLIPYLLRLEGVTQNRDFWTSVAGLVSLEVIERHWGDFTDLDLTPLASAASRLWTATRVHLGPRSDTLGDENADTSPRWGVTGRVLSAGIGNWRITFAHTGTKLKALGRDLAPARWEDLKSVLADYTVTGADLAGVVTHSQYGAVEGADMKGRIDSFIEAADDSFHVPAVTVTIGSGEGRAMLKADFQDMLLTAVPHATIGVLARTAVDILGYRYPPDALDVEKLLDGENHEAESPGKIEAE